MAAIVASKSSIMLCKSSGSTKVGSSSFLNGNMLKLSLNTTRPAAKRAGLTVVAEAATEERIRLNNLHPLPGSRRSKMRKGRGHAAGQGLTCGYGNRGQKSRSGKPTRPGFEGGQNPLYRATPKLKGICGGMAAGKSKYVTVNLKDLAEYGFAEGDEVSLEVLKAKRKLNPSGREAKLPLKVLGEGEGLNLKIKAAAFSGSALEKIEAAGGSVEYVALKEKWTRAAHEARVAAAAEA
ncbi:60S ribosomal protein L15 [Cymbomonas tetramitiformis]|uniref:60S ribosomal protein L15 n=1 Tax=Cymbomonas tetramitiformis TaxID=36881 RepID=A0AAE0F737_9CHLO|nr:60S ribosomal protein L15 [Cymbomonas tetramitiformis]